MNGRKCYRERRTIKRVKKRKELAIGKKFNGSASLFPIKFIAALLISS